MSNTSSSPAGSARSLFVLLALLATLSLLRAAPFAERMPVIQADGTPIELWGQGDEFYAVFETLDGYTVVYDEASRGYCFAVLSEDGTALLSSGVPVQAGAPAGLAQHLRQSKTAIAQEAAARFARWDAAVGISQRWAALKQSTSQATVRGAQPSPPNSPTLGTKLGLTLLIDFSDAVGTIPQVEIFDFLNSDVYTNYSNRGSVKQYFQDVSGGALTYSNVLTVYIRVPQPKTYYNDTTEDCGIMGNLLIKDALDTLKAMSNYTSTILPLFDGLTVNSRNEVIACNVFFAGASSSRWSYGLWPHSWALYSVGKQELSPGGKKVFYYQITNIGSSLKIGTFCHENGHMLCDFPDLYDYTYDSVGAGMFCLMGSGNYGGSGGNPVQVCAYLKRAAGWATTTDLTSQSLVMATLNCRNNQFFRYANPSAATEYFLIENRCRTNRDAAVPGSGILVWHIDELGSNSSVNTNANSTHNNYEATIVQADNLWHLERNVNSGDANDLFYLGNTAAAYGNVFSDVSTPSAHWWNGTASSFMLREISAAAPVMTVMIGTNDPAPRLLLQPVDTVIAVGSNVTFFTTVSGLAPFSYQWLKDGSPIAGATQSSYLIPDARLNDAGAYAVVATNNYGSASSTNALLVVIEPLPLPFALNNSNFTWTTDPAAGWYGQAGVSHDYQASARSWFIGNGQQTWFTCSATGPGTLTFWWRVSSQTNADYLSFAYNGITQASISGEVGWEQRTIHLPVGVQALRWTYAKDASDRAGLDAAWVDQVSYVAGVTAPYFVTQPVGAGVSLGSPARLTVGAAGTPPLLYQWQLNGTPIAGATNSVYSLAAVRGTDGGIYSVLVSNQGGSAVSSNATLEVVPAVAVGNNSFNQRVIPVECLGAVAVAAGAWHSLALRADGVVLAWGNDWNGQCDVPVGLGRAIAIAAGGYHSLALRTNGSVVGWGSDDYGQASPPAGLTNVTALAAGGWHSLALRADGRVTAWGDNSFGQTTLPAKLTNVIAIAAGGSHCLALRADGTVVAWGNNLDAAGAFTGQSIVPMGLSDVVAIGAGDYHSLAVKRDGSIVAWGDNSQGQCRPPAGLPRVSAVAGGGAHSVALKADGTVVAWGNNENGQCDFPSGLADLIGVSAGEAHTLLLAASTVLAPQIVGVSRVGQQFTVRVQTVVGKYYALEYKNALNTTGWASLPGVRGDGSVASLVDSNATSAQRFYRVRQY